MNSTEQDISLLRSAAARIQSEVPQIYPELPPGSDSFFCDCSSLNLFPHSCFDYGFETPAELIAQLEAMWDFQQLPEMKAVARLCAASVFKLKGAPTAQAGEVPAISPFVYEF